MQWKRILLYLAIGIIGILLINLFASHYIQMEKAAQSFDMQKMKSLYFLGPLYCFLLGVLIRWRAVQMLITREIKLRPNLLLVPGILLLFAGCLSPAHIVPLGVHLPFPEGGVGLNMLLGPLEVSARINNILSIIAGAVIVRGLYKTEKKET